MVYRQFRAIILRFWGDRLLSNSRVPRPKGSGCVIAQAVARPRIARNTNQIASPNANPLPSNPVRKLKAIIPTLIGTIIAAAVIYGMSWIWISRMDDCGSLGHGLVYCMVVWSR